VLLLYNYHIIIIVLLWKHSCKVSEVTCNKCKDHGYEVWRSGSLLVSINEVNRRRSRWCADTSSAWPSLRG